MSAGAIGADGVLGSGVVRRVRRGVGALREPGLAGAVLVLAAAVAWAVRPGWFAGADPLHTDPARRLLPPGSGHWFGTDQLGRDVFARVVHGAAPSLLAALIAVLVALVAGTLIGVLAGTADGWVDTAVMRTLDVLLAMPGLLLSLAVVSALGFGGTQIAIAVGVGGVAAVARVARAEVLRVRSAEYVAAARLAGGGPVGVALRHVVPNSAAPVFALAALEFGTAVLNIAALSFLGFGAPPPEPQWGSLIADGRDHLASSWWLTTLPGLVLVAIVLAANRVGRALEREERGEAR